MNTLPCPFCACPKVKVESYSVFPGTPGGHVEYVVECRNCGAIGPSDLGISGAEEMWNLRRTEMPEATKEYWAKAEVTK